MHNLTGPIMPKHADGASQYYQTPSSQKPSSSTFAASNCSSGPSWSVNNVNNVNVNNNTNPFTLSPKEDYREVQSSSMSPITPGARSPPTSPGHENNAMSSLDPFGQLSLNDNNNNNNVSANNNGASYAYANNYTMNPNSNVPVVNNPKSPMQSGDYAPNSMNNTQAMYQSQTQPMVVSPEHGAGTLVPSSQPTNVYDPFQGFGMSSPQPAVYGQNNHQQPFGQQPQQMPTNNFQQPQQPQFNQMLQSPGQTNQAQPYANYSINNNSNNSSPSSNVIPNDAFSPPVSPLWAPASPQGNQQRASTQMPNGSPPGLPSGNPFDDVFGSAASPVANPQANNVAASAAPSADPFGNSNFAAPVPVASNNNNASNEQDEADFWADMGFGANPSSGSNNNNNVNNQAPNSPASTESSYDNFSPSPNVEEPLTLDANNLPTQGEYYTARVTTPLLGAIFSSGRELRNTLYSAASDQIVDAIGDRPVVSFTIDGSAADTAGIQLGHVLMKVNGQDVRNTDEAVALVGKSPRPLRMEMYIPPDVKVVKTEGQYMVKYDNGSTEAPSTCTEWKPKYVVAGDMLGKPHILYMYRSKAEYDIAVKEAQIPGKSLSVKVKQFDIRGARIVHENGQVRYPGKGTWYYFTVLRLNGLPIKISATRAEDLIPVYDGITGFLEREGRRKMKAAAERRERMNNSASSYGGAYGRETYY